MTLRSRSGFTLIELIVAALVLTVGVLSLSALVQRLSAALRKAHLIEAVDLLARSRMDSLIGLGYDGLAPNDSTLAGSGAVVMEDSVGLREILVVSQGDVGAISVSDSLVTRVRRP